MFNLVAKGLTLLLTIVGVSIGSSFLFLENSDKFGATVPLVVSNFTTSLQASISDTATSMTLVTGTDSAGTSLSGYTCFTLDEGTSSEEFVCGTASGTAITSMLRGISPTDGNLEVTALKKSHRRGGSVKITDHPIISILARQNNGQESLPNLVYYRNAMSFVTASASALVDKNYVDAGILAGAADATLTVKGIVEMATTAEINSGTQLGGTSARLFVNPSYLASSNYGTLLNDLADGILASPSTTFKILNEADIRGDLINSTHQLIAFNITASNSGDLLYYNGTDWADLTIGSTGQFLMSSVSGLPQWRYPTRLATITGDKTVSNTGTETDLWSQTVPGYSINTASSSLEFKTYFSGFGSIGNGDTYVINLKYGGSTIATITLTEASGVAGSTCGTIEGGIISAGTSSQVGWLSINGGECNIYSGTAATDEERIDGFAEGTATIDSTLAQTLALSVDDNATATADIIMELTNITVNR